MLRLTSEAFCRARDFVVANARDLDKALFAYYFEVSEPAGVLSELAKYQNEDGGFGRWIESDFALAASSPMATAVGFEYLCAVNAPAEHRIVRAAVNYLLSTFDVEQKRWRAVPKEVNDAPHAPWWHYREEDGGCVIDRSLGNPSAEIVGYLNCYRQLVPPAFLHQLTESFIEHLCALPDSADSMHEILCYLRMADYLPPDARECCLVKLRRLVQNTTETDVDKWNDYCATPLFYITSKESPLLDLFPDALAANLDHLIQTQGEDGSWKPNWSWGQYPEAWPEARRRWSGHLTVRNLKLLLEFGRIETSHTETLA